jgi:hypothetical protein
VPLILCNIPKSAAKSKTNRRAPIADLSASAVLLREFTTKASVLQAQLRTSSTARVAQSRHLRPTTVSFSQLTHALQMMLNLGEHSIYHGLTPYTPSLLFILFLSSFGIFLWGYDLGATAFLLYALQENSYLGDDDGYKFYHLTNATQGAVVASSSIGALVMLPLLLRVDAAMSKKDMISMSAFFFFVGSIIISSADEVSWKGSTGLVLVVLGRFVYGMGTAAALHASPLYVSDLVPVNVKER